MLENIRIDLVLFCLLDFIINVVCKKFIGSWESALHSLKVYGLEI